MREYSLTPITPAIGAEISGIDLSLAFISSSIRSNLSGFDRIICIDFSETKIFHHKTILHWLIALAK